MIGIYINFHFQNIYTLCISINVIVSVFSTLEFNILQLALQFEVLSFKKTKSNRIILFPLFMLSACNFLQIFICWQLNYFDPFLIHLFFTLLVLLHLYVYDIYFLFVYMYVCVCVYIFKCWFCW